MYDLTWKRKPRPRKLQGMPELTYTCAFRKIQKILKLYKNGKFVCIYIQVIHTRANFQNKMTFYVLCAKKTKSAIKKICIHIFFLTTHFVFFAQCTWNVISAWEFARMWSTYIHMTPIFFRFFLHILLFFWFFWKQRVQVSSGTIHPHSKYLALLQTYPQFGY